MRTRPPQSALVLTAPHCCRPEHGRPWPPEKVRVGKAVPEAFSFVPLDIGMQKGFFKKHNLEVESIAFAGDAKMQQAAAAGADRLPAGLRARHGLHRQGLAGQGRCRDGRPAALARDRRAPRRPEDRRRAQGQEDQRLDAGFADLFPRQRDLAAPGMGTERHRHQADGRDARTDRRPEARRHRRRHHGYRQCLRPREARRRTHIWFASPT